MTQGTLELKNNKLEAVSQEDFAKAKAALEKANIPWPYYMLEGK